MWPLASEPQSTVTCVQLRCLETHLLLIYLLTYLLTCLRPLSVSQDAALNYKFIVQ